MRGPGVLLLVFTSKQFPEKNFPKPWSLHLTYVCMLSYQNCFMFWFWWLQFKAWCNGCNFIPVKKWNSKIPYYSFYFLHESINITVKIIFDHDIAIFPVAVGYWNLITFSVFQLHSIFFQNVFDIQFLRLDYIQLLMPA